MAKQYNFKLEDRPGALADVAQVFGSAGINISGGLGFAVNGQGYVSFVSLKGNSVEKFLNDAGIQYEQQDVLVTNLSDEPGQLSKLTRAFSDANVNLNSLCITMDGKQIFGVDDIEAAKQVANEFGVLVS